MADEGRVSVTRLAPDEKSFAAVCLFLAGKGVFARTPFGQLVKVLNGQIRGGTHAAVIENGRIVAYAGYLAVEPASAEAWMQRQGELVVDQTGKSQAVALSVVAAENGKHVTPLLNALRLQKPDAVVYVQRARAAGQPARRVKFRLKAPL